MQIAVLRMDLGKNSGSVVGLDGRGRVILRRRLQRQGVVKLAAGPPNCLAVMEACCGAHHLGRTLRQQAPPIRHATPTPPPRDRLRLQRRAVGHLTAIFFGSLLPEQ
jgi:hypothetical protein